MNSPAQDQGHLQRQSFGSVLSRTPLVTVSVRSHFHLSPAGIGPYACAKAPAAPSLHFLFLAWSHEAADEPQLAARDIQDAFKPFPRADVVVLANTAAEVAALRQSGLDAVEASLLIGINDTIYQPTDPDPAFPPCDAVYVAALETYKRHELAVGIASLRLLYWRPTASDLARVRRQLPQADFANHRIGAGPHALIRGPHYCAAVQSARVGLCLSDVEGPMRASLEYALLDLPIVTTPGIGGRLEYMDKAHCLVVPPSADAVAKAVSELARNRAPPGVVRTAALSRLNGDRARALELMSDRANTTFGTCAPSLVEIHPRNWSIWRTRSLESILSDH